MRLAQMSLDIVCICDFSGKILWSNQVECKITGFSREELDQFSPTELIHPDDLQKVADGLSDAAANVLHPCTELRTRCKDGTWKWISWSGVPLLEEKKLYAMGRDITAQKNAEHMVRNLAAIVEASTEAIFGIDNKGLISSWNRGAEILYGYSAAELLGHPVNILIDDIKALDFNSEDVIRTLNQSETEHKCKSGRSVAVSVAAFPVSDQTGKPAWAAIVRDISLQKEAERSIAEFYSITSHELRTPLSSVRGVLSLLENGLVEPASTEGRELIGMARSSSERLVRLVNDILDLRRIESGSISLNLEPVQINDLLFSAIGNIKGVAIEAGVDIEKEISSFAPPVVQCDKDRIIQVLTNLLSNGIKYSGKGQAVRVQVARQDNSYTRFSVIDQGPGIPQEQVSKLFKKFGQLDSSDARPKEGIGLGLFIARSIVEKHNGKIGISPSKHGGCHFWFDLAST